MNGIGSGWGKYGAWGCGPGDPYGDGEGSALLTDTGSGNGGMHNMLGAGYNRGDGHGYGDGDGGGCLPMTLRQPPYAMSNYSDAPDNLPALILVSQLLGDFV